MRSLIAKFRRAIQPTLPDPRTTPATKAALRSAQAHWQARAAQGPLDLTECGLRVFSQFEEDGLLLAVFAAIGADHQTFVDIGSGDGINSNCANLALNFGWHGLYLDGDAAKIAQGEAFYTNHPDTFLYPPAFRAAMVTRDNINALIAHAGFGGPVDLLSLDIDGNDYWIWDALTAVQPRVVIVESNAAFGERPVTMPYNPTFVYTDDYFGAGPEAFRRLANRKGYRLVGANRYGFNLIFVRRGIGESVLPEVPLERVRRHARTAETDRLYAAISGRPLVTVE